MTTSDITREQLDKIRSALEAISLVRLVSSSFEAQGVRYPAVRPAEVPASTPSFSLALDAGLGWVGGVFLADTFAGEIVRQLGDVATGDPASWAQLVSSGELSGVSTRIWVNSFPVTCDALPPTPWRSAEIECRARVTRRGTRDANFEGWTRAAGTCLALVMTALGMEEIDDFPLGLPEGAESQSLTSRYERNPANRLACIAYHGHVCWVCDFDFGGAYGDLGRSFIVVHHILPVSMMPADYRVDPVREMVPLCSNCHSMVHRTTPPIHPVELRRLRGMPLRDSAFLHEASTRGGNP